MCVISFSAGFSFLVRRSNHPLNKTTCGQVLDDAFYRFILDVSTLQRLGWNVPNTLRGLIVVDKYFGY